MRNRALLAAVLASVVVPGFASAQVVWSDGFSSSAPAELANYNTYITAGATGPSGDVTFAYDYGAGLGIPSAPGTTDGSTLGLRVRSDNLQSSIAAASVGASEVTTVGLNVVAPYTVSVEVWGNYIGGSNISASGSNGSTGASVGIGSKGNAIQYIAGNDGAIAEAFNDNGGGANLEYRMYVNNVHPLPNTAGSSTVYAAGNTSTSASSTDPYYTFLGSHTAPATEVTASPSTQGGSTPGGGPLPLNPGGIIGFAWHNVTLTDDGTNVIWAIDGNTITTTPLSAYTFGGNQVSLGMDDSGLSGNSTAINQLLNADIFDNLTVTEFPEPASISLLGLGAMSLLARRRK